jgi:phenylalanyl-tRNA synthetase alpha chain
MSEQLQQLVLDTLDKHSTIVDTRSLDVTDKSDPYEAQLAILGALNSLLSRDVRKTYSALSSAHTL